MSIIDRRLLSIIGKRIPASYDAIFPHGPRIGLSSRVSEVALNPQPLPPHELGAAIAAEFIQSMWLAERFGINHENVFDELDDWCPTRPALPKLPPWWPPVPDPDPGPEPHPEWFSAFHLGFAARIAAVSQEFEGTRAGEMLNKAVDRSLSSIESVMG